MKAVRAATAEEVTGNDNCTSAFKPHEPAHSAPHIVSYWTMNPEQSYRNCPTRALIPMTKAYALGTKKPKRRQRNMPISAPEHPN